MTTPTASNTSGPSRARCDLGLGLTKPNLRNQRESSRAMNRLLDINCDLGEGESPEQTRALMERIDTANLACGGHAGNLTSLRNGLRLAHELGVRPGAHPGLTQPGNFGRSHPDSLTSGELTRILDQQAGLAWDVGQELGIPLTHIKLHGALYHAVDDDAELADAYLAHVARRWPGLAVIARAGGAVVRRSFQGPVRVWKEAFLDRAYRADGTLVPRGEPGAVLSDAVTVVHRLRDLAEAGGWRAVDGTWIRLDPDTLCIHGDSPAALAMLSELRQMHPKPSSATPWIRP